MRAKFYKLNVEGSSIESIHTAVLSSSHILDDNYLVRVLDIMKPPHKKRGHGWKEPKMRLKQNSRSSFLITKKILYKIADYLFNNTFNQRMRRGMLQNVGGVWYEQIYPKKEILIEKK